MYSVKPHVLKNTYLVVEGERIISEQETLELAEGLCVSLHRALSNIDMTQRRPLGTKRKHEWAFLHGANGHLFHKRSA
jgi:hypothetical protein